MPFMSQYPEEDIILSIVASLIGIATASLAIWISSPSSNNSQPHLPGTSPEFTFPDMKLGNPRQQQVLDRLRNELFQLTVVRDDPRALQRWKESLQEHEIEALRDGLIALEQINSTHPSSQDQQSIRARNVQRMLHSVDHRLAQLQLDDSAQNVSLDRRHSLHRRRRVENLRSQPTRQSAASARSRNAPHPSQHGTPSSNSRRPPTQSNPADRQIFQEPAIAHPMRNEPRIAQTQFRRPSRNELHIHQHERHPRRVNPNHTPGQSASTGNAQAVPSPNPQRVRVTIPSQPSPSHPPRHRDVYLPAELTSYLSTLTPEENDQLLALYREISIRYCAETPSPQGEAYSRALERCTTAVGQLYLPRALALLERMRGASNDRAVASESEIDIAARVPLPEIVVNGASEGGSVSSTASTLVNATGNDTGSGGSSSSNVSAEIIEIREEGPRVSWADEVEEDVNNGAPGDAGRTDS